MQGLASQRPRSHCQALVATPPPHQALSKIDDISDRLANYFNGTEIPSDNEIKTLDDWCKNGVAEAQLAVSRVKVQLEQADSFKDSASRSTA